MNNNSFKKEAKGNPKGSLNENKDISNCFDILSSFTNKIKDNSKSLCPSGIDSNSLMRHWGADGLRVKILPPVIIQIKCITIKRWHKWTD